MKRLSRVQPDVRPEGEAGIDLAISSLFFSALLRGAQIVADRNQRLMHVQRDGERASDARAKSMPLSRRNTGRSAAAAMASAMRSSAPQMLGSPSTVSGRASVICCVLRQVRLA